MPSKKQQYAVKLLAKIVITNVIYIVIVYFVYFKNEGHPPKLGSAQENFD
jgi:hypothetical protein